MFTSEEHFKSFCAVVMALLVLTIIALLTMTVVSNIPEWASATIACVLVFVYFATSDFEFVKIIVRKCRGVAIQKEQNEQVPFVPMQVK